jgi:hypothetical protein
MLQVPSRITRPSRAILLAALIVAPPQDFTSPRLREAPIATAMASAFGGGAVAIRLMVAENGDGGE